MLTETTLYITMIDEQFPQKLQNAITVKHSQVTMPLDRLHIKLIAEFPPTIQIS